MAQLRVSKLADGAVRGARRIRFRRWTVAISAIALIAGSAAAAAVLLTAPTTPLAPTASATAGADAQGGGGRIPQAYASSSEAALYIAALRGRPTPGAGMDLGGVYVENVRCTSAEPGETCDPDPMPMELQTEIRRAVPEVHFVTRAEAVDLHGVVLVRFGQITYSDGSATRAYVPIAVHCGPLCGEGTTLVLARQQDEAWKVIGTTGLSWIS